MTPTHLNPVQWQQALGYSRQACARVFRDGGRPDDALKAFGLPTREEDPDSNWSRVVEQIADALCVSPVCANASQTRKAA